MPANKKSINLLPEDEFEASFVGKLLKWALTIGRYIVIGTELVVIGSFLARFSLDRQVTDLNEAIAQKQAVLNSYGDLEKQARSIQSRLTLIADLTGRQLKVASLIQEIQRFTPVNTVYTRMVLGQQKIDLNGVAFSEAGFRTLVNELNGNDRFEEVSLKQLSSSGKADLGIKFEIEVRRKDGV